MLLLLCFFGMFGYDWSMSEAPEESLQKEFEHFKNIRESLMQEHRDRWVVIKGEKVLGPVDTFRDAQVIGAQAFGAEPFFVGQLVPDKHNRIATPYFAHAAG